VKDKIRPSAGKILIVEDDTGICEVVCTLLHEVGFSCICASSDEAAYAVLTKHKDWAGLIADINLGTGTTGFDVARFARQYVPDLPVMYISGASSPRSYAAFGVPGSEYLAKPFNGPELVLRMEELVKQRSQRSD